MSVLVGLQSAGTIDYDSMVVMFLAETVRDWPGGTKGSYSKQCVTQCHIATFICNYLATWDAALQLIILHSIE